MTTTLALLVGSGFAVGVLGIATVVLFILFGGDNVWFQAVALLQGVFATAMVLCLSVAFVYVFYTVNK